MAVVDLADWLRGLGLERYEETFRANDVDADVLPELNDADLEKLGVSLGHRKKLLKAIAALAEAQPTRATTALPAGPGAVGERRQVTVLFCDLVGYTALSRQLDAEEVHALLERFFEQVDDLVERFGGTVDKHIGDCVMAVFGAPRSRSRTRCRRLAPTSAARSPCTSASPPVRSLPAAPGARPTGNTP